MKTKIMVVLGTRPEVIKLAPVLFELKKYNRHFKTDLVWTGQHIELAKPFLKLFRLRPQFCFEIMRPNQSSSYICSKTMQKLGRLFDKQRPDLVFVQGDTTTALTAALCAFYQKIPVAHLEAGLRSGDPHQPFPEEKNRELISHLAEWNFAPTLKSKENLLREGINPKSIYVVGNSVVDALQWLLKNRLPHKTFPNVSFNKGNEKLVVVTAHRRESFGRPLKNICGAISKLAQRHKDLKIIFPVHLNPQVRTTVLKNLNGSRQIHLLNPLDYASFIYLLTQASAILTDSGGIQEEAPCLGKPVFVLRDTTERPEGIEQGASLLVGRNSRKIVTQVEKILFDSIAYKKMAKIRYPFGRGGTARKVVQILMRDLR